MRRVCFTSGYRLCERVLISWRKSQYRYERFSEVLVLPDVNQRITDAVAMENNPGDGTDVEFNRFMVVDLWFYNGW